MGGLAGRGARRVYHPIRTSADGEDCEVVAQRFDSVRIQARIDGRSRAGHGSMTVVEVAASACAMCTG